MLDWIYETERLAFFSLFLSLQREQHHLESIKATQNQYIYVLITLIELMYMDVAESIHIMMVYVIKANLFVSNFDLLRCITCA